MTTASVTISIWPHDPPYEPSTWEMGDDVVGVHVLQCLTLAGPREQLAGVLVAALTALYATDTPAPAGTEVARVPTRWQFGVTSIEPTTPDGGGPRVA